LVIDVHSHAVPPQLLTALRRDDGGCGVRIATSDDGVALFVGTRPVGTLHRPLLDTAARIAAMDEAGIDLQLVSSWIGIMAYDLPGAHGGRWARLFNDALAEMVAEHPDRLLGLCTVPLQDPVRAVQELQRAIGAGFAGAEIATTVNGAELDDPSLEPFWAAAAELQCIVLLHPDLSLPGRSNARFYLNNLVGNGAETTIAVAHMLFAGVLERHPDLRLCLVHGGAHLPYQAGRLDHGFAVAPRLTATATTQRPSDQLKRLYFDTVTHSTEVLRFLINFAGPDHVVLGSDYPFDMGERDPVGFVRSVPGLSEPDRAMIMEGNARRLVDGIRAASGWTQS
jgi:aminocarboxymuconate-semialdehyde decarboxylase